MQPQGEAAAEGEALSGTLDRSQSGTPIPEFTLTSETNETLELASLTGEPLLINLWATWCAPCVIELPMLDEVAGDTSRGIRVLTVSQDMTDTDKVAPFLQERGLTRLEPWLDPRNDLAFHYGTGTLPTTILYDANGREIWRYIGGYDWTSAEATELLAEVTQ